MDGINRKNRKRIMRKVSQSQPFSRGKEATVEPESSIPTSSNLRKHKKKNHQHVQKNRTPQHPIRKHEQRSNLQNFYLKLGILISSKWATRLGKVIAVFGILVIIINTQNITTVVLRPHLAYIDLNEAISAYRTPKEDELGFEIIAVTDEVSIPIMATGERPIESYSQGLITLFNDYSSEPQRLLPETRFESASGKIFKLGSEEVVIPGKLGDEPSSIVTQAYAVVAGPNHNIDSTDFTIPGFKEAGLNEKYNKIYGVSTEPFKGGFIGVEQYITEEQRIIAEIDLKEQLRERLLLKLSKEKTEELMLIEGTAQLKYRELISVFNENETGIMTQRGTILALGVGNTQLDNFLTKNFIKTENTPTRLSSNDINLSFDGDPIDFKDQKKVNINISGSPLFSWSIDEQAFRESIRGVKKKELPLILEENTDIDKAHIKVRPFWRMNVANDSEKIKLSFE